MASVIAPPFFDGVSIGSDKALDEVEAIFTGWGCPCLGMEVLRQMPRLRVIFHAAGTVRGIVAPELMAAGVRVSSAAQVNALPVAEFTYAAMVFAARFVWQNAAAASQRRAFAAPAPLGLVGASIGLISLSRVGRLVVEKLKDSGASLFAYDPLVTRGEARALGVELCPLDEIFSQCSIVSCHTPLLPATVGLIRGEHFQRLCKGAHFINTARGAIVMENEMIDVLLKRPDLSATLDVTTVEPLPMDSALRALPNVILTPHLAGSQGRECFRLGQFAVDEFERYLGGLPLQGEVLPDRISAMA